MGDEIIEPSEILVDGDGTVRREETHARPWLRFLGRMFDYAVFFLAITEVRALLGGSSPKTPLLEGLIPFEYILWIPIEATFLWGIGTTPGKWLLGTQLRQGKNLRLDYATAFKRSAKVWLRGIGMAIPIVNAICLLIAYQRLLVFKTTTWDRDEHIQITHRRVGTWRVVCAAVIAIFGMAYHFSLR